MYKILLFIALAAQTITAQKLKHNVFQVNLTDKNDTPYSLFHPEEFLTPRSLERRERYGIELDESDLPISPTYIRAIEATGGIIHARSKWFNALAVYVQDSAMLRKVQELSCVQSMRPLGKWREARPAPLETKRARKSDYKKTPLYHGYAAPQTRLSNMHVLHGWGFQGQGMHVAIFDGGFNNVYRSPAFDSINTRGQILGTHDFVDHDDFVYESSTHGTNVLSTMGANLPYLLVGTSPYAQYYLFKTEDVISETWIEEFNWVAAAEYADSLGVDVINSSLGYTTFNDTTMSYKYKDLNGKTALISRGADMAMLKGVMVVNSAGNEGRGKWRYIGAPADAYTIVTVGAVNAEGFKADFSSWGPTADGRIKPNLVAVGDGTAVAAMTEYDVSYADGTSFSSPVMAGMLTAFWQIFPEMSNLEIKQLAEESASQAENPDAGLGYGIPDFYYAYIKAHPSLVLIDVKGNLYHKKAVVRDEFDLLIEVEKTATIHLDLYDIAQHKVWEAHDLTAAQEVRRVTIPKIEELPSGVYLLRVEVNQMPYWVELVKE